MLANVNWDVNNRIVDIKNKKSLDYQCWSLRRAIIIGLVISRLDRCSRIFTDVSSDVTSRILVRIRMAIMYYVCSISFGFSSSQW